MYVTDQTGETLLYRRSGGGFTGKYLFIIFVHYDNLCMMIYNCPLISPLSSLNFI